MARTTRMSDVDHRRTQLEALLAVNSLAEVVDTLSLIAYAKAAHHEASGGSAAGRAYCSAADLLSQAVLRIAI